MNLNRILTILFIFTLLTGCENTFHNTALSADNENNDAVADNTDDSDTAELQISDIKVETNENNVLSCRLTFNTSEKIKTIVKYSSKTHSGYEMDEDLEKTEHYFFLWGMRAEMKYNISIYSAENPSELLGTAEFTTGSLPSTTPAMFLNINNKEKVLDGFTLFTFSATTEEKAQPLALMVDTEGEVVWYFEYYQAGYSIMCDLQYIDETKTILASIIKGFNMADIPAEEAVEIDLEGNVVWKAPAIANVYADENSWNHIYERLPDDSIVMLRYEWLGPIMTEKIVNVDRDYDELWTWRFLDHFDPPECDLDSCEWTHANTISMFKDENITYLNSRNLSTYYKIDMTTGDVLWKFGKDGDFTLITDNSDPWFDLAHDPEPSSVNAETVLFYDNGSVTRNRSRIIEYSLDQDTMTAEISFEYDGSQDGHEWFSEYWGDADRMPNGNIFVTVGLYDFNQYSRLFEVTREGELVWELLMDRETDFMITLYNAQKIPTEKLLKRQ